MIRKTTIAIGVIAFIVALGTLGDMETSHIASGAGLMRILLCLIILSACWVVCRVYGRKEVDK